MASAETLLARLAERMGLAALALDENRVCRLLFDNHLAVDLEIPEGDGVLHLIGTIGVLPPEGRESIYEQLLEFNIPTDQPGMPSCAVDQAACEILLCQSVALPTEADDLFDLLELFLNHLESWQERLSTDAQAADDATRAGAKPGDDFLRV